MNNVIEFDVGFSWSIWTEDIECWESKYPELIEELRKLEFGKAIKITSSSKKTSGSGQVIIFKGAHDSYLAKGTFYTNWGDDFVEVVANDYDLDVEDVSFNEELAILEIFPIHDSGRGCKREFTVSNDTVECLIRDIDHEESKLLEDDSIQRQFVDEFFSHWEG